MKLFSETILYWYSKNKRELPWRNTSDPYKIWLSEIILQQTRVAQGIPYYLKFVETFTTVQDLADAPEDRVLKLWQGLGYYSRARNLHATAKIIIEKYGGVFPTTHHELLKLKGIGDYTASAISSICFGELQAVVDGNVYRVLARYFGVDLAINETEGIKYFKTLAKKVMSTTNIRDYNQGIMEFGAIQCTPKKPNCSQCLLKNSCVALQKNSIHMLPVKLKKNTLTKRYFNYLVVIDAKENTLINQRLRKGIWQNLWQFPLLETNGELAINEIKDKMKGVLSFESTAKIYQYNQKIIVHKLSHQHLYTNFWIVKTNTILKEAIPWTALEKYPVPVLISDFIKTFKNSYF